MRRKNIVYIYIFNGWLRLLHAREFGSAVLSALPLHTTWSVLILFAGHDEGEASEGGRG